MKPDRGFALPERNVPGANRTGVALHFAKVETTLESTPESLKLCQTLGLRATNYPGLHFLRAIPPIERLALFCAVILPSQTCLSSTLISLRARVSHTTCGGLCWQLTTLTVRNDAKD